MPPLNAPSENQTSAEQRAEQTADTTRLPLRELESHLHTSYQKGLSPKEAEKRLKEQPPRLSSPYMKVSIGAAIKTALAEPVLWLLLVVSGVAILFDRATLGILSILFIVLHTAVTVVVNYKTHRLYADLEIYRVPLCRVIRNGRLLRVRDTDIVPGDILVLRRGDHISADARLISAKGLVVLEETLDGDKNQRETLTLKKDPSVIPEKTPYRHSPEHMVYAGSTVRKGQGRAVAVSVGDHTHRGALEKNSDEAMELPLPAFPKKLKKTLSAVNLILAVSVIPLTALGILLLGRRYSFIDLFMSTLALAVLTLTEHTVVMILHHYATAARLAAEDADAENSAELRNPETLEKLARMDHLILLGTSALHDGVPHPLYAYTSGEMHRFDQGATDETLQAFVERLYLLSLGQAERLKSGAYQAFPYLESAVRTICDRIPVDSEALMLRLERMEAKGDSIELQLRDEPLVSLNLVSDIRALDRCVGIREGMKRTLFTQEKRTEFEGAVLAAGQAGLRVMILISSQNGKDFAEGFVAFAPGLCRKTKGCIQGLEDMGVTVTAFLRDRLPEDEKALAYNGLIHRDEAYDLLLQKSPSTYEEVVSSGIRTFFNARTDDVLDYVDELHEKGKCVGVFSVERVDLPVQNAADLVLTTATLAVSDTLWNGQPMICGAEGIIPDGDPDSATAAYRTLCDAHIVVRRCSPHGGGVLGVRRALLAAKQALEGLNHTFRFVLLSQIMRFVMLFLLFASGSAMISAPILLVSGLALDAIVAFCYTQCDLKSGAEHQTYLPPTRVRAIFDSYKTDIILSTVSVVVPVVIACFSHYLGDSSIGDLSYFVALSLIATQIAVFLTGPMPRKRRRGFFTMILAIGIYIGILSLALISGLHFLWCLALPLVQPLIWILGYAVFRKLRRKNS